MPFITKVQPNVGSGFKRIELFESQSPDVRMIYDDVIGNEVDTLIGANDATRKFRLACASLKMSADQRAALEQLECEMRRIEESIDPNLLKFSIDVSPDDDIVLSHTDVDGISSLILHEDGLIAFSFIARKGSARQDQLTFHEETDIDWEGLALRFLIGQGR